MVEEISRDFVALRDTGNGLSPVRRQAIIWTNADLTTRRPATNLSEI